MYPNTYYFVINTNYLTRNYDHDKRKKKTNYKIINQNGLYIKRQRNKNDSNNFTYTIMNCGRPPTTHIHTKEKNNNNIITRHTWYRQSHKTWYHDITDTTLPGTADRRRWSRFMIIVLGPLSETMTDRSPVRDTNNRNLASVCVWKYHDRNYTRSAPADI